MVNGLWRRRGCEYTVEQIVRIIETQVKLCQACTRSDHRWHRLIETLKVNRGLYDSTDKGLTFLCNLQIVCFLVVWFLAAWYPSPASSALNIHAFLSPMKALGSVRPSLFGYRKTGNSPQNTGLCHRTVSATNDFAYASAIRSSNQYKAGRTKTSRQP